MPEYILRDPTAVDRGCGRGEGGEMSIWAKFCVLYRFDLLRQWMKCDLMLKKKKTTEYISFKCGGRERRNGNSKARQDVLNRQSMKGIQINLKDSV